MANQTQSLRELKRKLKHILSRRSEEEEESDEISKSIKRRNDFISTDDLVKELKLRFGTEADSVYKHILKLGKSLTYADFNRVHQRERKEEQYEDSYDEQEFESVSYVTYDEESDDISSLEELSSDEQEFTLADANDESEDDVSDDDNGCVLN